jgi:hypothetical protein
MYFCFNQTVTAVGRRIIRAAKYHISTTADHIVVVQMSGQQLFGGFTVVSHICESNKFPTHRVAVIGMWPKRDGLPPSGQPVWLL